MKITLAVLYFKSIDAEEKQTLETQCKILQSMYGEEAEFLAPIPVGEQIPEEADAVLFPQLVGEAFTQKDALAKINLPMLVLTSEFGTVEMWDWEIVSFLREEVGLNIFTPYSVELAKCILRALACKKMLQSGMKFLIFQDSRGEGMQANIFKRNYWFQDACTEAIEKTFGVEIVYRSYKELCDQAHAVTDEEAERACAGWLVPREDVSHENYLRGVKVYVALKQAIDEIGGVEGVGANCLNESFYSDTTPCLAFNILFEKDGIMWNCEGDTVSLLSQFIFYQSLRLPLMMSNLYPFLMGMAAIKHEKIDRFPDIPNADNHALAVHCGYFGLVPQSFCSSWMLRPKVLGIVNENALMVDCRLAEGPVMLAKIHANMKKMTIISCEISDYVQYPGSDCRNGALLHYKNDNGHEVMSALSSHHAIIIQGDCKAELIQMGQVFGFDINIL